MYSAAIAQGHKMLQLFETPIKRDSLAAKPTSKSALGQYMTPPNISAFMASLLPKPSGVDETIPHPVRSHRAWTGTLAYLVYTA
jgi:hypothetical protein